MRPDYAAHLTKLGAFESRGHAGGRYRMQLFANAAGKNAWQNHAQAMTAGALFAAAHTEDGRAGPLLVMQKRAAGYDSGHGDWYYAVADSAARRVLRQGRLADCAACHSMSPTDYVFLSENPAVQSR